MWKQLVELANKVFSLVRKRQQHEEIFKELRQELKEIRQEIKAISLSWPLFGLGYKRLTYLRSGSQCRPTDVLTLITTSPINWAGRGPGRR